MSRTPTLIIVIVGISLPWSASLHAEEASTAVAPAEETRAAAAPSDSVSVDPAGFLLFGPALRGEVALGPVALGVGLRWLSPSVLANSLFLASGSDEMAFSYGLSLHGNYFFRGDRSGLHAGLAVELLHTQIDNSSTGIASISSHVVPQLEGGHRWDLGGWSAGGVASLGYAAQVSSNAEALRSDANPSLYEVADESSPYGSARLDVGIYL